MAALKYRDEHNKVGFLEKPKGSADYHQVLDFLRVYGQLQLDDEGGVEDLPIADIYLGMDNLGYPTEGKLTFHKNKFSPQWRFLVHTILHCLSTKSGSWDQFGSQLAIALICLTEGRRYNWSSYIFKGMVNNINNPKKFLMFPRFLQMILEIEPRNTKQYHAFKLTSKMFANMRLNFQGDHMPLLGTMIPPAQAAIAGESSGEAAPSNPQTVPETITEPDHSHDHESTPPRPTTTTSSAPVNEQGPSSDPNIASSSRPHESAPDLFTSTNVEDEIMGGSFHTSPPRSTQAPPEGTTSGGAEDLDKLTALSSLVSTLVQKVNTQESELKAHKLLFKEVVGKLVKKVKLLEDKLKGRKRKFVMTDSDKEEDAEPDVDPLIKLAKAAATAAAALAVPTGGSHEADIPPSSSIPSDEFAGGSDVPAGATTGPFADPSNKGKSPLLEEDPPVRERTFRQKEEDRLGEEAARRMYEEEQAELEREREEMQRKRQQDVLNSAKYYTDSDWTDIMGQVHANQGLTADLLGPDVTKDNFAERMVALIAKRRRDFAAQRAAVAELKSQNIRRSLKRPGADLEQASSKKSKSTKAPNTTHCFLTQEDGDPEAEHKMCIKYASDEDSASDDDTPINFFAVVDWELLSTGLGSINAFYRKDNSRKCFTSLREILHLVTRADLMTIYGRVMTFYQDKQAAGVGLVLWGDLKVLMDSPKVNDEYRSSVNLLSKEMLDHQLEICHGTVGNELTTAVQLIAFLKKQISDSRRPKLVVNGFCLLENFGFWYTLLGLCDPKEQGQKRVKPSTSASGSQPSGNTKKDKIRQTPSSTQKNKVEAHPRKVKSSLKNKDCVVQPKGTAHVQHSKLNANSELKCVKCNGCMLSDNHDLCVLDFINNVNARKKSKSVNKSSKRKVWKPTGKVFSNIGYIWRPTGRTFTIVGNACPLTRITTTTEVPLRKPTALENETPKPVVTLVYPRKPRKSKTNVPISKSKVVQIVLWYLDSGCSKTGDRSQLTNFVNKFLGTIKFGNDHVAKILGYGDYQIGNVTISRVYHVEGLRHNLFSVGQFCDSNLEVAFRQHTCFIRNLEDVDLLTGSRGNNLYTLSLGDMIASSPICLLSKASKTKSWLWHRRLSHLNFGAINHLARHGLVRGLPKLKFEKDHLCSACAMGKSKKKLHKPKSKDTNHENSIFCTWIFMDQCVSQVLMEKSTSSSLSMISLDLHGLSS
ncbi:retrovirus-related pol polyprotein from transposon TNT 1-94 [Tanacetum coccineum]